MNIREKENALFKEWRKKYENSSFVIDGCPNPGVFFHEKRKVVYVLKDGNLGAPDLSHSVEDRTYDQRDEIEKFPTQWWLTIARWSYFLRNNSANWCDVEREIIGQDSIRESLSHHCFVQMKKSWGGGSVKNDVLDNIVTQDGKEITSQLSIYEPNFIVACGNGEHLAKAMNCKNSDFKKTSAGIGYWKIELKNRCCYVIDYCHPSVRAGTKIKGLISIGLSVAILEIEKVPN